MSSELTFVNKETNFREILFPQYQKGRKGTADTRTPGFSIKRRTKTKKTKKLHVIVVRKRLKRQKIHIHSPYITTCKEQKKKK